MFRLCALFLIVLPLAGRAQAPVAPILPRQPALQLHGPPILVPEIERLRVCSVRCLFILTPEPRAVPDEIWLRLWLGRPPGLR